MPGAPYARAFCRRTPLLLGGGAVGGKVHTRWPGLADSQLDPPGDLRVTTDYRDVLAEVLSCRCANAHIEAIFPGSVPRPVGAIRVG